MNTGVTTNKNSLGLIVFIVALGTLWNVRCSLLIHKDESNQEAGSFSLSIRCLRSLWRSWGCSHCATAVACFILGGGLMLATSLDAIRKRPGRVRALCLVVVLAGGLGMLFGGDSALSSALGRGNGLSGRTYMRAAAIVTGRQPGNWHGVLKVLECRVAPKSIEFSSKTGSSA